MKASIQARGPGAGLERGETVGRRRGWQVQSLKILGSTEPGSRSELEKPQSGFRGQRPDPILTLQRTLRAALRIAGQGRGREDTAAVRSEVGG